MMTTRTIEQILRNRHRAAELRVMERAAAAVKIQDQIRSAIVLDELELKLAKALESKQLAENDLAIVAAEVRAQQGHGELAPYEPAGSFMQCRYAAVLMLDNPALTPEQATEQAAQDERARFEALYAPEFYDEDDEDA